MNLLYTQYTDITKKHIPITIINIYDDIDQLFEYVKGENMLIFSSFLLDRQLDKSSKIWFAFYDNCACEALSTP